MAIARAAMDDGEHVLYAAEGAARFAMARGFTPASEEDMITAVARERFAGIVIRTAPTADRDTPVAGLDQVGRLVPVLAAVAQTPGEHGVFLVTENAQQVLPDEPIDLSQGGLRGLVRVFAMEQPGTATVQIDLDTDSDASDVAAQLLSGAAEDDRPQRARRVREDVPRELALRRRGRAEVGGEPPEARAHHLRRAGL